MKINLKHLNGRKSGRSQAKTAAVSGYWIKRNGRRTWVRAYTRTNTRKAQTVTTRTRRVAVAKKQSAKRRSANKPLIQWPEKFFLYSMLVVAVVGFVQILLTGEPEIESVIDVPNTAEIVELEDAVEGLESVEKFIEDGKGQTLTQEQLLEIERAEIAAVVPASCHRWIPLVQSYSWDTRTAMAVMVAEVNSCNPEIANRAATEDHRRWCGRMGSMGLFQLATCWADFFGVTEADLFDGERNIDWAYQVWQRSGQSFHQWGAFTNGSYQRWLAR